MLPAAFTFFEPLAGLGLLGAIAAGFWFAWRARRRHARLVAVVGRRADYTTLFRSVL